MNAVPSLAPPGRLKNRVFGVYFVILLMMALFPPFYLSVSGSTVIILGIPLPIFYWILIAVLMGVGLTGLYVAESAAGEIPEEGGAQ
jgi:amino acid transporter